MKTTQRLALVALLVLATAVPAMAASKRPMYAVGDEPNASGFAFIQTDNHLNMSVKVSCNHLTPGESYHVVCWVLLIGSDDFYPYVRGSFVADRNGSGSTQWVGVGAGMWSRIEVYRDDGQLVLSTTPP